MKIFTPGLLKATLDWFRIYKIPAGSKPNQFAFNEEFQDRESALHVINLTHKLWKKLISNEVDPAENEIKDFKLFNTDLTDDNMFKQTHEKANQTVQSLINSLKPTLKQESTLQCEKVFYLNKKEIIIYYAHY